MSTLTNARALLLAAFEAQGVRTATTGQFSAPVVLVEPGDPWTEPHRLPGRLSRWRLTAIGGRADTEGALDALGDLIDRTDRALKTVPGASLPTWARPVDYTLGGVPYAATVATITTPADLNGG